MCILINWVLDYFFIIFNLYKIYLYVVVENFKVVYFYEECGFVEEGYLVEEFFINGCY